MIDLMPTDLLIKRRWSPSSLVLWSDPKLSALIETLTYAYYWLSHNICRSPTPKTNSIRPHDLIISAWNNMLLYIVKRIHDKNVAPLASPIRSRWSDADKLDEAYLAPFEHAILYMKLQSDRHRLIWCRGFYYCTNTLAPLICFKVVYATRCSSLRTES